MFTVLLACGGGGFLILLPFVFLAAAGLWLAVKTSGYYLVGCVLARAHPEIRRGPAELMGALLVGGAISLPAILVAGFLAGSFVAALAALAVLRLATWLWFAWAFVVPRARFVRLDTLAWAVAGTAWSFLLDLTAAGVFVALYYLLAVLLA